MTAVLVISRLAIRIHALDVHGIGDAPPTYHIAANAATSSYKLRYPKAYRIIHECMQHV